MTQLVLKAPESPSIFNLQVAEGIGIHEVLDTAKADSSTFTQGQEIVTKLLQPIKDCDNEFSLLSSIKFFNMLNELFNTDNVEITEQCKQLGIDSYILFYKVKVIYRNFGHKFLQLSDGDLNVTRSKREIKLIEMLYGLYGYQSRGNGLIPKVKGVEPYGDNEWRLVFDGVGIYRSDRDKFFNHLSTSAANLGSAQKLENSIIVLNLNENAVPEFDVLAKTSWDRFLNE